MRTGGCSQSDQSAPSWPSGSLALAWLNQRGPVKGNCLEGVQGYFDFLLLISWGDVRSGANPILTRKADLTMNKIVCGIMSGSSRVSGAVSLP